MGADTSTLHSIESLNQSLDDLTNKLKSIEILQCKNERIVSLDNKVYVADKEISCRPDIQLIVGPVVGLIGTNFSRILIEINEEADISFFVFAIEQQFDRDIGVPTFIYDKTFHLMGNEATAFTLDNLNPDTKYDIYVGGVQSSDILLKYASFMTLPHGYEVSNTKKSTNPIRILFNHQSRLDKALPEEFNILSNIEKCIIDNHPVSSQPSRSQSPVHMLIHNGSILSFEDKIQSKVMNLLDILLNEDSCDLTWYYILLDIETIIMNSYRKVFTDPSVALVFRRCSNIFIAGESEAMLNTIYLLLNEHKPTENNDITNGKSDIVDDDDFKIVANNIENSQLENLEETNDISDEELKRNKIGYSDGFNEVEKEKEKQILSVDTFKQQSVFRQDMKVDAAGLLIRIARRCYWRYMRQLWDENTLELIDEDETIEEYIRVIIMNKKKQALLSALYRNIYHSKINLISNFDSTKAMRLQINTRLQGILKDITILEYEAIKYFDEFDVILQHRMVQSSHSLNCVCLYLGSIILCIIDTSWEILGKNNKIRSVQIDYRLEALIDDEVFSTLDMYLGNKIKSTEVTLESNMYATNNNTNKIINTFLLISSTPLISPYSMSALYPNISSFQMPSQTKTGSMQIYNNFHAIVSPRNVLEIFERLCKWQQDSLDHSVLVAMPFAPELHLSPQSLVKYSINNSNYLLHNYVKKDSNNNDANDNPSSLYSVIPTTPANTSTSQTKDIYLTSIAISSGISSGWIVPKSLATRDDFNDIGWDETRSMLKVILLYPLDKRSHIIPRKSTSTLLKYGKQQKRMMEYSMIGDEININKDLDGKDTNVNNLEVKPEAVNSLNTATVDKVIAQNVTNISESQFFDVLFRLDDDESATNQNITAIKEAIALRGRRFFWDITIHSAVVSKLYAIPSINAASNTVIPEPSYVEAHRVGIIPKMFRQPINSLVNTLSHLPNHIVSNSSINNPNIVVLGPIICRVQPYSAVILMEFDINGYIELNVINQITGQLHISMKSVHAHECVYFKFHHLQPECAYDIVLPASNLVEETSNNKRSKSKASGANSNSPNVGGGKSKMLASSGSLAISPSIVEPAIELTPAEIDTVNVMTPNSWRDCVRGSFTTPRVKRSYDNEQDYSQHQQIVKNLHQQADTAEAMVKKKKPGANQLLSQDIDNDEETIRNLKNKLKHDLNRKPDGFAEDIRITGSEDQSRSSIYSILALGSNTRYSMEYVTHTHPHLKSSQTTEFIPSYDTSILEGIALTRDITSILSQPWNNIQLVLHLGQNIDFSAVRDDIIAYTRQLELFLYRNESINVGPSELEILNRIETCLRNCYRLNWHSSYIMRSLLAYGPGCNTSSKNSQFGDNSIQCCSVAGHVFVPNHPILDILNIFGEDSIDELSNDYNATVISTLIDILTRLQQDYQLYSNISNYSTKNINDISSYNSLSLCNDVIEDEDVIVFNLKSSYIHSTTGETNRNLSISNHQFVEFESFLKRIQQNLDLRSNDKLYQPLLVIVSPVPLISLEKRNSMSLKTSVALSGNHLNQDDSYLRDTIAFNTADSLRFLDLLTTHWLRCSREATVICSGIYGYMSDISICSLPNSDFNSRSDVYKLQQVCCGPSIGSSIIPSYIASMSNDALQPEAISASLSDGFLSSFSYNYKFQHNLIPIQFSSHFGVISCVRQNSELSLNSSQMNANFVGKVVAKSNFYSRQTVSSFASSVLPSNLSPLPSIFPSKSNEPVSNIESKFKLVKNKDEIWNTIVQNILVFDRQQQILKEHKKQMENVTLTDKLSSNLTHSLNNTESSLPTEIETVKTDEVAMQILTVLNKIVHDYSRVFKLCHHRYKSLDIYENSFGFGTVYDRSKGAQSDQQQDRSTNANISSHHSEEPSSESHVDYEHLRMSIELKTAIYLNSQTIQSIWKEFLFHYLPSNVTAVLPEPSTYVIQRLWEVYIVRTSNELRQTLFKPKEESIHLNSENDHKEENTDQAIESSYPSDEVKRTDTESNLPKQLYENKVVNSESRQLIPVISILALIISQLRNDSEYFTRFLFEIMSCQLLSEYYSYSSGNNFYVDFKE